MATKHYYFSGYSKWSQVFGKGDERYKAWKIEVSLLPESQELFDESGCQLQARRDEDGKSYYKFRRDHSKLVGKEVVNFDPPEVVDKDGNPWTNESLIGNGSLVTVRVSVFDTAKGKGHRLEKVRVDTLIPYISTPKTHEPEILPPMEGSPF